MIHKLCMLRVSDASKYLVLSEESQNESDTTPNTSDPGSKQEIYNVRLEDDDLVICKKEDLEQSKNTHLHTINLDLCDDQLENPMEDIQNKTRNAQTTDLERIVRFNSKDEFVDPQCQKGTAEFRGSDLRDSEVSIPSISKCFQ